MDFEATHQQLPGTSMRLSADMRRIVAGMTRDHWRWAHVAAGANQSILLLDAVGRLERRVINNNGALGPVFSVHTERAASTGFSAYAVADGAHLFMLRGPT